MIKLSDYEFAKLRLQAFEMLDGWGVHNEKGVHIPHDMKRRREIADEFINWALMRDAEEVEKV